jgi:hypothetical protein
VGPLPKELEHVVDQLDDRVGELHPVPEPTVGEAALELLRALWRAWGRFWSQP